MKKRLVFALILITITASFFGVSNDKSYASNGGSINIKFKVKSEDSAEFLTGFLKIMPVPRDVNGAPLYPDEDWVEIHTKQYLYSIYKQGKIILAQENPTVEDIEFEDL